MKNYRVFGMWAQEGIELVAVGDEKVSDVLGFALGFARKCIVRPGMFESEDEYVESVDYNYGDGDGEINTFEKAIDRVTYELDGMIEVALIDEYGLMFIEEELCGRLGIDKFLEGKEKLSREDEEILGDMIHEGFLSLEK
jgi:hypothetical protein